MKQVIFVLTAVFAATAVTASPLVAPDSVSISRSEANAVKIAYTLTGEPAIVTIDIQTNTVAGGTGEWVSIGQEGRGLIQGAANRPVNIIGEESSAYWFPNKTFAGMSLDSIRATVTVWPTNNPPDYLVVDLKAGGTVVKFYPSVDDLPGGLGNPVYRRTQMVMRKIPAKGVVWLMGSPNSLDDPNNATYNDFAHKVRLTADYYAGVFEVTQGQLVALDRPNYSKYADDPNFEELPAERLGWASIYALIEVARARSGITTLDLPTEAQWEYACHAGCGGKLYNGLDYTEANLKTIAWYHGNASQTMPVGTRAPNEFGLYDMLGNVWEFTKDVMGINTGANLYLESYQNALASGWQTGSVTDDPQGATNSSGRKMKRGGSWYESFSSDGYMHRTNARSDASTNWAEGPSGTVGYIGCRLFCSVEGAVAGANGCPQLSQ